MDKWDAVWATIRQLVEKQKEAQETMKQIVLAVARKEAIEKAKLKGRDGLTIHEWTLISSEALYRAGLGPKPHHMVLKERMRNAQSS